MGNRMKEKFTRWMDQSSMTSQGFRSRDSLSSDSRRQKDLKIRCLPTQDRKHGRNQKISVGQKQIILSITSSYDLCKTRLNFTQLCGRWNNHSHSRMKKHSENNSERLSDHHLMHQWNHWRNPKATESRIFCMLSWHKRLEKSSLSIERADEYDERSLQESSMNGHCNDSHESWKSVQQEREVMPSMMMWLWSFPDSRCELRKEHDSEAANAMVSDSKIITDQMKLFTACEERTRKTSQMHICETSWRHWLIREISIEKAWRMAVLSKSQFLIS